MRNWFEYSYKIFIARVCHSLFQKYVCYMMRWNTKKMRTCT